MSLRKLAATALVGTAATVGPSPAIEDIPSRALAAYINAAASAPCPVDWATLAAVGAVETGHAQSGGSELTADGVATQIIGSSAGARGPMQFMPGTWQHYATDGDGDGQADVDDIDDAAASAAALLCANSIHGDWVEAICAYNGGANWRSYGESRNYVEAVSAHRDRYATADPRLLPLPGTATPTGVARTDTSAAPPVERTVESLWTRLVHAWVRLGESMRTVGLDPLWVRVDHALFGDPPVQMEDGSWVATAELP